MMDQKHHAGRLLILADVQIAIYWLSVRMLLFLVQSEFIVENKFKMFSHMKLFMNQSEV